MLKQQIPGKPLNAAYTLFGFPHSDVWSKLIKSTNKTYYKLKSAWYRICVIQITA